MSCESTRVFKYVVVSEHKKTVKASNQKISYYPLSCDEERMILDASLTISNGILEIKGKEEKLLYVHDGIKSNGLVSIDGVHPDDKHYFYTKKVRKGLLSGFKEELYFLHKNSPTFVRFGNSPNVELYMSHFRLEVIEQRSNNEK